MCVDCMREYNADRYTAKKAQIVQPGPKRFRHEDQQKAQLILSTDETFVYTDHHWEDYDPNDGPYNRALWKEATIRVERGTYERDLIESQRG